MRGFLQIQNLSIVVEGKTVVENINLKIEPGQLHTIMGPNGSGKSSLALSVMGHPAYYVQAGKIILNGQDLLSKKPNERVSMGIFVTFQNPVAVPGISLGQVLFASYQAANSKQVDIKKFYSKVKKQLRLLDLKEEMLERDINDGFSGGEKKKAEILSLLCLSPKFVIFDEIDSGLDIDSLKKVAEVIKSLINRRVGVVLITHHQRILKYIKPDVVHILKMGKIIKTGNYKLAMEVEKKGYAKI